MEWGAGVALDEAKMAESTGGSPEGCESFLRELKERVRGARARAALAVNSELVRLYWSIRRDILDRQERLEWGAKVIDRLAVDLRWESPDARGFSGRNLNQMRSFARAWPDIGFVQWPLAQLTWWHNLALLEKVKDPDTRVCYAQKAIEQGGSRNALVIHIGGGCSRRRVER